MNTLIASKRLILNDRQKQQVSINQILFLEGDINYTRFHFQYQKDIIISRPIKHFETTLLSQGFLRIHRSYLVNSRFIQSTNLEDLTVILIDGTELKVARRRVKILLNNLNK